jgi:acyl carrier protein
MATNPIYFLLFLAVALPLIWWLMWREDFDGIQSEWRYNRERKKRERLSLRQFYERFYETSGVDSDIISRLLSLHAEHFQIDPEILRPTDDYFRIAGGDEAVFLAELKSEFGITIPDDDLKDIDGSFDSIARHLDRRLRIPPKTVA